MVRSFVVVGCMLMVGCGGEDAGLAGLGGGGKSDEGATQIQAPTKPAFEESLLKKAAIENPALACQVIRKLFNLPGTTSTSTATLASNDVRYHGVRSSYHLEHCDQSGVILNIKYWMPDKWESSWTMQFDLTEGNHRAVSFNAEPYAMGCNPHTSNIRFVENGNIGNHQCEAGMLVTTSLDKSSCRTWLDAHQTDQTEMNNTYCHSLGVTTVYPAGSEHVYSIQFVPGKG